MDVESAEEHLQLSWCSLAADPLPLNLLRFASSDVPTANSAVSPTTSLLALASAEPTPVATSASAAAAHLRRAVDSYALDTRIDAVDEKGVPFVPFVRPLTLREFELLYSYGVMLNSELRTVLVSAAGGPAVPTDSADLYLAQFRILSDDECRHPVIRNVAAPQEGAVDQHQHGAAAAAPPPPPSAFDDEETKQQLQDDAAAARQESDDEIHRRNRLPRYRPSVVPLFRLNFICDKAVHHEGGGGSAGHTERLWFLSGVFASGHRFSSVHDDTRQAEGAVHAPTVDYYDRMHLGNSAALRQRQEAWAAWSQHTKSSIIADPRDGNNARRQGGDRTCGYDAPGVEHFQEIADSVIAHAPAASSLACGDDFIPRECTYATDRMASRVLIHPRQRVTRSVWTSLCRELDLVRGGDTANNNNAADLDPARAVRLIWKDTRHGDNKVIPGDGELLGFLPPDSDVVLHSIYGTDSEEQLRLWLLRALVTAEANGSVRQILVPVDLPFLVGRCAGLLSLRPLSELRGGDGAAAAPLGASDCAKQHALRIIIETVESFMRGCGKLWRVVLSLELNEDYCQGPTEYEDGTEVEEDDEGAAAAFVAFRFARRELLRLQREKNTHEAVNPVMPSPTRRCIRPVTPKPVHPDELPTLSPSRKGRPGSSPYRSVNRGASQSIGNKAIALKGGAPRDSASEEPAVKALEAAAVALNDNLIMRASISGVPLKDSQLRDVFNRLDTKKDGLLSRDELRKIFMKQDGGKYNSVELTDRNTIAPRRAQAAHLASGSCLSPIDDCGLPMSDEQVDAYLGKFCRVHTGRRGGPMMMTYPEFCVMMLELARR